MERVSNPPNPWTDGHVEWIGRPPEVELEVFEERARSILSENDSPDIPFRYSVNPYRGCQHGCAYCYARPTHQYIDFGAGTDFERRLVVKVNAGEQLRREIVDPEWRREPITFSGVTDCYQPLESSYEVTRDCLEVCEAIGNPVCIVTKSALVRRDTDLLASIAEDVGARVCVSIPFAEDGRARKIEPTAAAVSQRFRTIEHLSEAGIQTGVAVAPVIPGLNDSAIPDILDRAAEAGASTAFMTLLRLPRQVEPVFEERLRNQFPDRADKVMNTLREMRGGDLNAPDFGDRMVGEGPRWQTIESLFELHCRKYGLRASQRPDVQSLEPAGSVQASLFDR